MTGCLDLYGLAVAITSEDAAVGAAVRDRLRRFPPAAGRLPDLRFEYHGDARKTRRPTGSGRPVYDTPRGEVLYFEARDSLYIDCGERVRVLCEAAAGRVVVTVGSNAAGNLWLLARPLFTLPLLELAKRRGRYGLHAAALALNGRGILFPGGSGAGKSTLAIALMRGGWDLLGDDLVFLRTAEDGVQALAFPEDIDLTDATARFFPDLSGSLRSRARDGWPKSQLAAERLPGVRTVSECRPCALVFPRVADTARSHLRPMAPAEALLELAPTVLLTDPRSSQVQLDALARLVRQCSCLRLDTGRDFDELPDRLGALVGVEPGARIAPSRAVLAPESELRS